MYENLATPNLLLGQIDMHTNAVKLINSSNRHITECDDLFIALPLNLTTFVCIVIS